MDDARAALIEVAAQMSDDELLQRWSGGCLTELATEVFRTEFARRGIPAPPYAVKVSTEEQPVKARSVLTVSPSADLGSDEEAPPDFMEVAHSEGYGDLEAAVLRLVAERIPYRAIRSSSFFFGELGPKPIVTLLVPAQFVTEARQVVSLVRSGRFSVDDDESLRE